LQPVNAGAATLQPSQPLPNPLRFLPPVASARWPVHSQFLCRVFFFAFFFFFFFVRASERAVFVIVLKINDCPAVGFR
jgi:hypothetical protein